MESINLSITTTRNHKALTPALSSFLFLWRCFLVPHETEKTILSFYPKYPSLVIKHTFYVLFLAELQLSAVIFTVNFSKSSSFTVNLVKVSRRLPPILHEWTNIIRVVHTAIFQLTKNSSLTFGAQISVCYWKPRDAQEKRVSYYLLSHDFSSLLKQKHNFFSSTSFDRTFNCSIANKLFTLV